MIASYYEPSDENEEFPYPLEQYCDGRISRVTQVIPILKDDIVADAADASITAGNLKEQYEAYMLKALGKDVTQATKENMHTDATTAQENAMLYFDTVIRACQQRNPFRLSRDTPVTKSPQTIVHQPVGDDFRAWQNTADKFSTIHMLMRQANTDTDTGHLVNIVTILLLHEQEQVNQVEFQRVTYPTAKHIAKLTVRRHMLMQYLEAIREADLERINGCRNFVMGLYNIWEGYGQQEETHPASNGIEAFIVCPNEDTFINALLEVHLLLQNYTINGAQGATREVQLIQLMEIDYVATLLGAAINASLITEDQYTRQQMLAPGLTQLYALIEPSVYFLQNRTKLRLFWEKNMQIILAQNAEIDETWAPFQVGHLPITAKIEHQKECILAFGKTPNVNTLEAMLVAFREINYCLMHNNNHASDTAPKREIEVEPTNLLYATQVAIHEKLKVFLQAISRYKQNKHAFRDCYQIIEATIICNLLADNLKLMPYYDVDEVERFKATLLDNLH